MLQTQESEVQMQLIVNGRPINTSIPLSLVACICEDDSFRNEFLRRFEFGDDGREQFIWTYDATKLLIEKYKYELENFNNPLLKKQSLWAKIARYLQKEGHNVTGYMCDKKFRTLRTSYRLMKEKMNAGQTRKHWEYFKLMDDLYAKNIAIRSKASLTSISPSLPIHNICVQTSFSNFCSGTSVEACDGSGTIFLRDSLLEGLSRICEEPSKVDVQDQTCNVRLQEESKVELDVYKQQLLEIERQRLEEFRRFNNIYSRIATALEQKNYLYQKYLQSKE